jgi:hypothetical protein
MFRNIDNNISQYNWHKLCIWLGSVILIIIGFLLIVFKSINFPFINDNSRRIDDFRTKLLFIHWNG